MKKNYLTLLSVCLFILSTSAQTIIPASDELVLPQYAYYGGVRAANRMPVACRLKLSGLTPGATYRYLVGMSSTSNLTTTQAPGNMYRINNVLSLTGYGYITGFAVTKAINSTEINNDEMRTDNTSRHARLTADGTGSYTGWFACAPIGTASQQVNGSDVYFYVNLNDGGSGLTLAQSYRTTSTVRLLNYSSTPGNAAGCTGLLGTSDVGSEKMVTLYDNTGGTGRPLYCTFTENNNSGGSLNEGTLWTNPVLYPAVDAVTGSWAAIIPNSLSGGVKAINFYNIDGTAVILSNSPAPNTSSNGTWNGVSTANPAGDSTAPITINSIASSTLPIELISFNATAKKEGVFLNWITANETNNKYFELNRSNDDRNFTTIAKIDGALNSVGYRNYSFVDRTPETGNNYYQLKQIDIDGRSKVYKTIVVKIRQGNQSIRLISSSSSEVIVSIYSNLNSNGQIIYTNTQGSILYKQTTSLSLGENIVRVPVTGFSKEMGVISFVSQNFEITNLKFIR